MQDIQLLPTHRRYVDNPTLLTGCEVRVHRTHHTPPTYHPSWSLEQQLQASMYHCLHNHQSTPPNVHLHIHSPPGIPLLFSMDHIVVAVQSSVIPIIVYNQLGRLHKIYGFSKLTIRLTYVCVWQKIKQQLVQFVRQRRSPGHDHSYMILDTALLYGGRLLGHPLLRCFTENQVRRTLHMWTIIGGTRLRSTVSSIRLQKINKSTWDDWFYNGLCFSASLQS